MTTKLDKLVGYLAGRDGDPRFLEELDDPASDASLFLEAARTRSKALIQEFPSAESGQTSKSERPQIGPIAWVLLIMGLIVAGLAFWIIGARLRQIEANHQRVESEARASATRLEVAMGRILEKSSEPLTLEPITSAVGRVETRIDRLEGQVEQLGRSLSTANPDSAAVPLRQELERLRGELATAEKAKARQIEELQASIHELGRVLRLILSRIEPPPTNPETPRPVGPR